MKEFIVYRNPLEAAIWGSLSNGGLFPILVAMFVAVVVIVVGICLVDRYVARSYGKTQKHKRWSNAVLVLGAVAAALVLWVM